MKNIICLIFGHKKILRNWYPNDKISNISCLRCEEKIKEFPNPAYNKDWIFKIKENEK